MTDPIFKYNENIVWSLPLLFGYEYVWHSIFKKFEEYEININNKINLYGAPDCLWKGTKKTNAPEEITGQVLNKTFEYVSQINAKPYFLFNNTSLEKDDLKNPFCNYLLALIQDTNANFIIYSDDLKNYIKEKNSNTNIVSSILKPQFKFNNNDLTNEKNIENETNYYNDLLKEYDIVKVRPEYSLNVLSSHPEYIDDISRIDITINQSCISNCPKFVECCKYLENYDKAHNFECIKKDINNCEILNKSLVHDNKTINNLIKIGINNLSIAEESKAYNGFILTAIIYGQMFNQDGNNNLLYNEGIFVRINGEYLNQNSFLGIKS